VTAGLAPLISILLAIWPPAAWPVQQSEQAPPAGAVKEDPPAPPDPQEAVRQALLSPASEQPARVNAAIELLAADLKLLANQLATSENDDVVRAILDAVQIRVAQHERTVELVPALLSLSVAEGRGDLPERALATLGSIDGAWAAKTRPVFEAALKGGDPKRALAAARALSLTRDLTVVDPLLDLLEKAEGRGPLADSCRKALTELLGVDFGNDIQKWRAFWAECAGKSRDRILEDALARLRQEHQALLEAKNREIVRLKREQDGSDPQALIADLNDELPGVRKFAAELLVRGPAEWDLAPARPTVIGRLKAGTEPPDLQVDLLQLLKAIDLRAGKTGDEPERDGLVVASLGSDVPQKVIAALEVAEQFPAAQVRDEVLRILRGLSERPLTVEVRVALVEACAEGKLTLRAARDSLLTLLRNDPAAKVRLSVVSTLGSLKLQDTRQDLARVLLEDADWQVRRRAASALRIVSENPPLEALVKALDDSKPEVRSEAVTVLAALSGSVTATKLSGEQHPLVVSALAERLGREDVINVRAALVRALGQLGSMAALPALCEAALKAPPINGSAPDPAVGALVESIREVLSQLAGADPARWADVAARFEGKEEWLRFALSQQLTAMRAAGAEASAVLPIRVRLARAALAAGVLDQVLAVAAGDSSPVPAPENGTPQNGADLGLQSELAVIHGEALSRQGDAAGAAAQFDRALALGGLAQTRLQVLGLAADAYRQAGNPDRARELLAAEAELPPEQLLVLARLEGAALRWPEAIARYRAWLKAASGAVPAERFTVRLELVEALLKANDAAGALAALPAPADLPKDADPDLRTRLETLAAKVQEAQAPPPPGKPEDKPADQPGAATETKPVPPSTQGGGGFEGASTGR